MELLCTTDGRASCCVYATDNGNSTIWFLFRVALVLVVSRGLRSREGAKTLQLSADRQ